jgi:nickel/cobalt exporter
MVPCPEALGIMLIAIGLNRILLGLGMVVAFSFGLAAVLIAIGILLVRAKSLLDNVSSAGRQWQTWLPLASAIIVTLLGLAIMAKGLWSYVGGCIGVVTCLTFAPGIVD